MVAVLNIVAIVIVICTVATNLVTAVVTTTCNVYKNNVYKGTTSCTKDCYHYQTYVGTKWVTNAGCDECSNIFPSPPFLRPGLGIALQYTTCERKYITTFDNKLVEGQQKNRLCCSGFDMCNKDWIPNEVSNEANEKTGCKGLWKLSCKAECDKADIAYNRQNMCKK